METVYGMIGQWCGYVGFSELLCEVIREQIKREESMDMEQLIDRDTILVPESLEEHYYDVFPEVFDRLYRGLTDRTRIYDALVDIFADFAIHFQETVDTFSEHHKGQLYDLTDLTITVTNSTLGERSSIFIQDDIAAPGSKRELAGEILKAVEQELRAARFVGH
jgi:hypothetical protein